MFEHFFGQSLAAILLQEVRRALDLHLLGRGRDQIAERPVPLSDTGRSGPGRRTRPTPASATGTARRRPHASRVRPARPRPSAPEAGTARHRPSTRHSGTARRRRRPHRREVSVAVAPWITKPTGRSGFFSAKSRHARNPLETRPVNRPGVEDRKRANAIGVLHRPPQSDRTTPVLHDDDRVAADQGRPAPATSARCGGRRCTTPGRSACPIGRTPHSRVRRPGAQRPPAGRSSCGTDTPNSAHRESTRSAFRSVGPSST